MGGRESDEVTAEELIQQLPRIPDDEGRDTVVATVKSEDLLKEKEDKPQEAEENSEEERPEEEATAETEEKPASEEPEAGSETEEEEEAEELSPFLASLKEQGIGEFKSEEEGWKAIKHLRNRLSQRDEAAAFGRFVQEAGVTPDQIEAWAKNATKDEPEKETTPDSNGVFNPPHPYNPAWETMIRPKLDEDGQPTGEYSGPPGEVQKYVEYMAAERVFWDRVRRDPSALVNQEHINKLVDERVSEALKTRDEKDLDEQARTATEEFLAEHGEYITAHEEAFMELVKSGMFPETALEHLQMKDKLAELEDGSKKGSSAIEKDLGKKAKRTTRRAAATVSPIRKEEKFDPGKASSDELLERAVGRMQENDEEVPADLAS
jgi:hypothetical protein